MIKEWIDSYKPKNLQESENALREIMQEIALAGLYSGKSTQIDPLNPSETDPLIPFQIDPLIPGETDPLKIA